MRFRPRLGSLGRMPNSEQVQAAVDAYCDAYARNDKAAFLDAFADDGVVIDPVGTPPHAGRQARGEFWDGVHALADTINLVVHHLHICGNEAAMVFTINARTGDGGMEIDAVDIFHVGDDGRITRMAAYWDMAAARPLAD